MKLRIYTVLPLVLLLASCGGGSDPVDQNETPVILPDQDGTEIPDNEEMAPVDIGMPGDIDDVPEPDNGEGSNGGEQEQPNIPDIVLMAPTNVTIRFSKGDEVIVSWTQPLQNIITGFDVLEDGVLVAENLNSTSYVGTFPSGTVSRTWSVATVYVDGSRSEFATGTLEQDGIVPIENIYRPGPANLSYAVNEQSNTITLNWDVPQGGDIPVSGYDVLVDDILVLANTPVTTFTGPTPTEAPFTRSWTVYTVFSDGSRSDEGIAIDLSFAAGGGDGGFTGGPDSGLLNGDNYRDVVAEILQLSTVEFMEPYVGSNIFDSLSLATLIFSETRTNGILHSLYECQNGGTYTEDTSDFNTISIAFTTRRFDDCLLGDILFAGFMEIDQATGTTDYVLAVDQFGERLNISGLIKTNDADSSVTWNFQNVNNENDSLRGFNLVMTPDNSNTPATMSVDFSYSAPLIDGSLDVSTPLTLESNDGISLYDTGVITITAEEDGSFIILNFDDGIDGSNNTFFVEVYNDAFQLVLTDTFIAVDENSLRCLVEPLSSAAEAYLYCGQL
jgi:hypothetical protein